MTHSSLDLDACRAAADRWALDHNHSDVRARQWHSALPPLPILHLEDISGIPFVEGVAGVEHYQHRARVRAGEGDLFASSTAPAAGYESYCKDHLGLGEVECVLALPTQGATAVAAACSQGSAFDTLSARARDAGGMILHPYMGIEAVWALAQKLEDASAQPVHVLAPTPPALWVANDKQLLDELVRHIGLEDILVETRSSQTPEGLAEAMRELAGRHARIGLKRTRCASAMGNEVHRSAELLAQPPSHTLALARAFLDRTQWPQGERVLVVEWATTELSPSTQLWVPPLGEGEPRLDGVFEQLLYGEEKMFLGSRPSTLPAGVNRALADASLQICAAFQQLGYMGRCSFDFLVLGDVHADFSIKLTECNGRWGGTSTPMHLMDRLVRGGRPAYIAQDVIHPELVGVQFEEILARTRAAGELFDPATQQGRFVYYNVGPLLTRGKLDVIAIGQDPADAHEAMNVVLARVLGIEQG